MDQVNADKQYKYKRAAEDIILQYTYPRIDAEVSKHRNHLLKSPFCVHPSTGRVCVPVNPSLVDDFDPATVPTVGDLLNELGNASAEVLEGRKVEGKRFLTRGSPSDGKDYEHTSLKPYVEMFEKHVSAVLRDARGAKRGEFRRTGHCQRLMVQLP